MSHQQSSLDPLSQAQAETDRLKREFSLAQQVISDQGQELKSVTAKAQHLESTVGAQRDQEYRNEATIAMVRHDRSKHLYLMDIRVHAWQSQAVVVLK